MKDLILIGGGGHCRSCIDVIECEGKFRILGILDKNLKIGTSVLRYSVIGDDSRIQELAGGGGGVMYFIFTLGKLELANLRKRLFDYLKKCNANISTIVSPLAHVSKYVSLGQGTIVMHHALVNSGAKIGENCIINSKSLVEHDAAVGDNCHVSTAAVINGGVVVGAGSFIGSNSVIVQGAQIPDASFIRCGCVVG
ncbi:MAG: NeuD/PglB/VioB family sugar acetyltransferase [Holosporales bacterium]|jgi:sugar O-acyltransferase (sialic acid O-acetyltransferase NeuD family)|nr:NeuD/PglB/VioB family sugar acetyltransferase [Holosporales bacterium]